MLLVRQVDFIFLSLNTLILFVLCFFFSGRNHFNTRKNMYLGNDPRGFLIYGLSEVVSRIRGASFLSSADDEFVF